MLLFFRPLQAQNILILFLKVLKFCMLSDGVSPLHMSWYYVYCIVPHLQGASTINKQLGYRTWIILPYQSTVCARDAKCFLIYQDVKTKASNLGGVWLYEESVSFFIFLFFLLRKFQPQIVLILFLFFERFQPQCSY